MDKTKIDWCDSTWNPVTGCFHGCQYCYARGIAERFGLPYAPKLGEPGMEGAGKYDTKEMGIDSMLELEKQYRKNGIGKAEPYPYSFFPTFHKYRLNDYINKKGRNIFVCSMADLFGKWVPNDWKIEVLEACYESPQHNYLFLTKDPIGYSIWKTEKHKDFDSVNAYTENMWLGVTYTGKERLEGHYTSRDIGVPTSIWTNFWYLWRMSGSILPTKAHKFISIEPLSCDICEVEDERNGGKLLEYFITPQLGKSCFEWIIVGAETGRRKGKVIPKREWIEKLVELCRKADIPVFLKSSLADIWGEPLIQEFPEVLRRKNGE